MRRINIKEMAAKSAFDKERSMAITEVAEVTESAGTHTV